MLRMPDPYRKNWTGFGGQVISAAPMKGTAKQKAKDCGHYR